MSIVEEEKLLGAVGSLLVLYDKRHKRSEAQWLRRGEVWHRDSVSIFLISRKVNQVLYR